MLSLLAADYFFIPPFNAFNLETGTASLLCLFTLIGGVMSRLNAAQRQTSTERAEMLERARQARHETEAERARLHELLARGAAAGGAAVKVVCAS